MNLQNIIQDLERYLDELRKTSREDSINRDYIEAAIEEFRAVDMEHEIVADEISRALEQFIDTSTHQAWIYVVDLTLTPLIEEAIEEYGQWNSEKKNYQSPIVQSLEDLMRTLTDDHRVFMSEEQWRIIDAIDILRGVDTSSNMDIYRIDEIQ